MMILMIDNTDTAINRVRAEPRHATQMVWLGSAHGLTGHTDVVGHISQKSGLSEIGQLQRSLWA